MSKDLWFDDGYVEDFTIVRGLLKKHGRVGILAIITGKIGDKGYLSIKQIKTMMSEGWKIASHSVTHRNFRELNLKEVEWELKTSKDWIKRNLGVEPIDFVAPYNSIARDQKEQKELALKYYTFVYGKRRDIIFHSKYLNREKEAREIDPKRVYNTRRAKHERIVLNNILGVEYDYEALPKFY